MKDFHPEPVFFLILAGVLALALVVGIGAVAVAKVQPVTGEDIDRIVREVQDADENGDNTVMVNVQAAAGFGIIQRAESSQAVTDTRTATMLPETKTAGLPAWQLILIVAACFLPMCALGCWLVFDKGVRL